MVPGHDGGLDLALKLDALVVSGQEVEDEGQHEQTDEHDEHGEVLLLVLGQVCGGGQVVDGRHQRRPEEAADDDAGVRDEVPHADLAPVARSIEQDDDSVEVES